MPVRRQSQTRNPPSPSFLLGLFKERPGGAAFCFARCCGIDTLPPGDELNQLVEAILMIFGFLSVCLIVQAHGGRPRHSGCQGTPTGGIVHPVRPFAKGGIAEWGERQKSGKGKLTPTDATHSV